jgi:GDP-L-fucose synthase
LGVKAIGNDLTREEEVERVYEYARPDVVINLAAFVGGIGLNRENPGKMFYENMRIGLFCTHLALKHKVKKYMYIGTVCGYPKFTPVPFKETDLWNGFPEETNAPYGVVKKSIGLMIESYVKQYGFNGMFLIPVNMYGPRDNFDLNSSHVIPALIRKMFEAKDAGTDVTLWGDGSATREFLYVYDCADAIIRAMEHYDGCEPINIGSGQEISIKDLANKIAEIVEFDKEIIWDTSKPNGQPRRCLDTTKAFEKFGFKASTSLDEGLKTTIDWYKQR